ncbi:MAG: hypothetical protein Q8880_12550, partial [Bacteroidota bacterium]|nr:hypothetical protein [Bacteroidota bacterium]
MKALFRPGMLMMNRFRIVSKFLLICFFLIALLVVALYQFFSSNNASIEFNKKERYGVEYAIPSKDLTKNIQGYHDLILQLLTADVETNRSLNEKIDSIKGNIDSELINIMKIDKNNYFVLNNKASKKEVSKDIEKISKEWVKLKIGCSKENLAEFEKKYSQIISDLSIMHTNISDNSNLTLDPDLDSYYCMDIIMFRQLSLSYNLFELKSLGRKLIKKDEISIQERKQLIILADQISTLV